MKYTLLNISIWLILLRRCFAKLLIRFQLSTWEVVYGSDCSNQINNESGVYFNFFHCFICFRSFNAALSTSKAVNLLFVVSLLFPLPVARLDAIGEIGYTKAAGRSIALSLLLENANRPKDISVNFYCCLNMFIFDYEFGESFESFQIKLFQRVMKFSLIAGNS